MALKLSGRDFRNFLDSKDPDIWPIGLYVEDELLRVNGIETEIQATYADTDVVEILGGSTAWENIPCDRSAPTLKTVARRWLKKQNELKIVVSVKRNQLESFAHAMNALGIKVNT